MATEPTKPADPIDPSGKPERNRRKRAATLSDVAAMAGVVAMTASRALNKSGYVSPEVMARVTDAARTLQYRPNVLARQLRGSQMHAVGILLPDIANPFCAELMRGISPVLRAAGYTPFIATAPTTVEEERIAIQSFIDHRTDGIIIATRNTEDGDEGLRLCAEQGIPIATIGRPLSFAGVDCVTSDQYQGTLDAVTHLIACGHKRIGFVGASVEDAGRLQKLDGYMKALAEAKIPLHAEYVVGSAAGPAFSTEEDGFKGTIALLALPEPPTAIFARNDYAAIGALRALHSLRLRVPEDVAVAAFDNIPMAAFLTPPLTTVEQPIVEQGKLAAEFLIRRIEGAPRSARQSKDLPCKLIVRESTQVAVALA